MGKTTVGKLVEKLVIETEVDGKPTIVTYPRGTIVEISSEDTYPTEYTEDDLDEAAAYLKEFDESPLILEQSVDHEAVIGWIGEAGEKYIIVINEYGDMMVSCNSNEFQDWRDFINKEEIAKCFKITVSHDE